MPLFSDGTIYDNESSLPTGQFAMQGDKLVFTRDFTQEEKSEYSKTSLNKFFSLYFFLFIFIFLDKFLKLFFNKQESIRFL